MNFTLFILVAYLIFPNYSIFLFDIKDILLIIYIIILIPKTTWKIDSDLLIIIFPSLMIVISFILKLLFGYTFDLNDIKELLRQLSLIIFIFFVYNQLSVYTYSDHKRFILKVRIISIFYVFILGIFSLIQYFLPDLYINSLGSLYEIEQTGEMVSRAFTNTELAYKLERVTTIFYTPIVFAYAISLIILFNHYMFKKDNIFIKYIFYSSMAIGVFAIFLSNSRAVLIITIILIIMKNLKLRKLIFVIPIIFFIFFNFYSLINIFEINLSVLNLSRLNELEAYISSGFSFQYLPSTLVLRMEDMDTILSRVPIEKLILTGFPSGYFLNLIGQGFHSQYLLMFVKFGIWGILISLWLIYVPIKIHKKKKHFVNYEFNRLTNTLIVIFIAIIIISFFQITLFQDRIRIFIFFLITIYFSYKNKLKEKNEYE